MPAYIALLRAVNVGGTGKLAMTDLKAMCEAEGFTHVQTYIASGNVLFCSESPAQAIKAALEARLQIYAGKSVGVMIRSIAEMAAVLSSNPFPDGAGNQVGVLFLNEPPPADALNQLKGQQKEELRLGKCEIYIHYVEGMGRSKLIIPAAKTATMRNINTVAKLVELGEKLPAI